jgi:hypothetical protein
MKGVGVGAGTDALFKRYLSEVSFITVNNTVLDCLDQCCGAGAARSRIIWSEPEPEPEP